MRSLRAQSHQTAEFLGCLIELSTAHQCGHLVLRGLHHGRLVDGVTPDGQQCHVLRKRLQTVVDNCDGGLELGLGDQIPRLARLSVSAGCSGGDGGGQVNCSFGSRTHLLGSRNLGRGRLDLSGARGFGFVSVAKWTRVCV